MNVRPSPLVALAALAALLSSLACGGSSDSGSSSPPPSGQARISYVALGDSTGFGVGALPGDGGYPPRLARRLREAGHTVSLANLSVPGADAADLAGVQLEAIAVHAPTLVTVCVGSNDVDRTPAEFAADLDAILAKVTSLGARVVVCNVPDVSLTPKYESDPGAAARVVALNVELTRLAAARNVPVADIYQVSQRVFAEPGLLSIDGFHPSAAGYELWAEAMLPVVTGVLGL